MAQPIPEEAVPELHPVRMLTRLTELALNQEQLHGQVVALAATQQDLTSSQQKQLDSTRSLEAALREEGNLRRREMEAIHVKIDEGQAAHEERRKMDLALVEARAGGYQDGRASITYRLPTGQLISLVGGVGVCATAASALLAFMAAHF